MGAPDIEVLFPDQEAVAKGEKIKIRPFGFGQLSRVARYVRPIAKAMLDSGLLTISRQEGSLLSTITLQDDFIPAMFQLLDEASEPLMSLVAFAIDKPRDWLDTLPLDEGIAITQQIWEVNSNFFDKRVMPKVAGMLTASTSTGATSSPASSAPATVAETSTNTP